MLSVHGLMRGHDLELGRDADTGGQTLYVINWQNRSDGIARRAGRCADASGRRLGRIPDYAVPCEPLGERASLCGWRAVHDAICARKASGILDQLVDRTLIYLRQQPRLPTSSTVITRMPVTSAYICRSCLAFRWCTRSFAWPLQTPASA